MIVINKRPSTVTLPCGKGQSHTFLPGKNVITEELFESVKEALGQKRFGNYSLMFNVIEPEKASKPGAEEKPDEKENVDDLFSYGAKEAIEIVKATASLGELEKYKASEERVTVVNAIKEQEKVIADFDQKIEDSKKEEEED